VPKEEAVNQVIETREVFTLDGLGGTLQGTYHLPRQKVPGLRTAGSDRKRTGVLLLSGLYTSRAGDGDSGVYWAESLAGLGYPAFRIDLPGSGDSGESIPVELLEFIDAGGFAAQVAAVVAELTVRYELAGMVILGHCSGAISALFGAAACKECRGVIPLAPYFHVSQPLKRKARRALIDWATRSRLGARLSSLYLRSKSVRSLLRRNALPKNANYPLIGRCKELACAGLPILVLKAPGPKLSVPKPQTSEFDYLQHIVSLAGGRSRIQVEIIEGAHHTFANRVGRAGVRQHVENWLTNYFPVEDGEEPANALQQTDAQRGQKLVDRKPIFARIDCALES
jgi:alpha-beta hydrolase superfamily lysophospholipase